MRWYRMWHGMVGVPDFIHTDSGFADHLCRLFGAKPLSKPMVTSHHSHQRDELRWDPETDHFWWKKFHFNMSSAILPQFYSSRGWVKGNSSWWRHQMVTFSALLALCAGNSPVAGEFPAQRPVTRSFNVIFELRLRKGYNREAGHLRRHRAHYDVIVMAHRPDEVGDKWKDVQFMRT